MRRSVNIVRSSAKQKWVQYFVTGHEKLQDKRGTREVAAGHVLRQY